MENKKEYKFRKYDFIYFWLFILFLGITYLVTLIMPGCPNHGILEFLLYFSIAFSIVFIILFFSVYKEYKFIGGKIYRLKYPKGTEYEEDEWVETFDI